MKVIGEAELAAVLDDRSLVECLRQAFREGAEAPLRHHHAIPAPGGEATLLIMPAWQAGRSLGVKVVTVFPGNAANLFIVSEATLVDDEGPLTVRVEKARGAKCERCWTYSPNVGRLPAHAGVCERCAPVLEAL